MYFFIHLTCDSSSTLRALSDERFLAAGGHASSVQDFPLLRECLPSTVVQIALPTAAADIA